MSISYEKSEIKPKESTTLKFDNCISKDSIFIKILVKVPRSQAISGRVVYTIDTVSAANYQFDGNEGSYEITRNFKNMNNNFYRQFTKKIICTNNSGYNILNIGVIVYDDDNGARYPMGDNSIIWLTKVQVACP